MSYIKVLTQVAVWNQLAFGHAVSYDTEVMPTQEMLELFSLL